MIDRSLIIKIHYFGIYIMEEYKCPLCKNEYNQNNPPRLLTMCGHTYCHHCIKSIIKRKDNRFSVRCPDDHLCINVETNSPSHFPKNIALLEAIRRQIKTKQQSQETNEFLPDQVANLKKSTMMGQSRSSLVELKEGLLGFRRMSLDEGMCLLHRKPLDIVCMEDKIHICAQCALFGLHKGHSFTTLKQLYQKNKDWSSKITEVIEEKQHIDTKILNGQIQKEVSFILNKKKDILNEQIDFCVKRIKSKIDEYEKEMRKELNSKIQKLEVELRSIMAIDPQLQEEFMTWGSKVGEKLQELDKASDSHIIIVDQKDQDLLLEGNHMLQSMKNELIRYWSKIESVLQYPKVIYSEQLEKQLSSLIKFQLQEEIPVKNQELLSLDVTKLDDFSLVEGKKGFQGLEEVSLLDVCKYEEEEAINNFNFSQISFMNESVHFKSSEVLMGKSEITPQKSMKRVKSRELNLNMSLVNSIEKAVGFKSPKQKMKTQVISRKNITSPTSAKAKLRRLVLKVKDPQKFQKLISCLEADNIDNIDLTGFEIGDEVAKQLCLKIQDCKRPKMLRLMKNNLTDQSSKQVIESLRVIDYLNLAQNNFTDKIFDTLLDLARRGLGKHKTVQLGQNHINSRKFKNKIEELKKIGVIITL